MRNQSRRARLLAAILLSPFFVWVLTATLWAQATLSTGNIQGTITDPSGAVVAGAKITVTQKETGTAIATTSTSSGNYSVNALVPGPYVIRVEAAGFQTTELAVIVQVGVTTPGNVKLRLGKSDIVVEVQSEQIAVNTEQSVVQGVMTAQQIDNLPINGRNFLDLAQLEPGVQIQDGGNFDPTKNGFSSISFGGRFGRTARIEEDGIDISDETVGTTTSNIPAGAIEEFNIGQSNLDLSSELTSSGSVNVVTRAGTNSVHGEAFYLFRDHNVNANLPGGVNPYFQRNQFGARVGGPVIKDKLFYFADVERIKQDEVAPVGVGGGITLPAGVVGYTSPFRELELLGKIDYQITPSAKFFYRFSYDKLRDVAGSVPAAFQPFANNNRTAVHAIGVDFNTGPWTHSIRFGYTKFDNGIGDAVAGTNIYNPAPGIELAIGTDPTCTLSGADVFCSGPNYLAPQSTFQSNHQLKYDGSRQLGAHTLRFGGSYNRIMGGGTAAFLALGPAVSSVLSPAINPPSDPTNPLTYPAQTVTFGNGQGYSSEFPSFGLPAGGLGPDHRVSAYIGDTWKVRPNVTLNFGLRYNRDTGRTDSDLGPIPCTELAPSLAAPLAAAGTPCTGNILDLYGKGLGNRVRQPNKNFAPQLGLAWDPRSNGKTVIRAGIGLYYENVIWNNSLYDRPPRLSQGLFLGFANACTNGTPSPSPIPGPNGPLTIDFCNQPIGSVASEIAQDQVAFQAATAAAGPQSNPGFIGNTLNSGYNTTGTTLFAPNFQTPRSLQMNIGLQRELFRGTVITVDYLRNIGTRSEMFYDVNRVGDSRYFNSGNAVAAINATAAAAGCASGLGPIAAVDCYIQNTASPTISDFATNGLDSGNVICAGSPCPNAAFPGINPNLGSNQMLFPIGRSVYNALQASWKQDIDRPIRAIRHANLTVSYSYSHYGATARDGDFVNSVYDARDPGRYIGPNGLDRTHLLSFGGFFTLPAGFKFSLIGHFDSPLPVDLTLPVSGNPGGIYQTDFTGDGTGDGSATSGGTGDLLPGTNVGAFGRTVSAGGLNKAIANYNAKYANQATPAGQVLIQNNLMTLSQLQQLGGVLPTLQTAPPSNVGLGWLKTFDFKLAWQYHIKEAATIEPSFGVFNLFNFANFDGPNSFVGGVLDGGTCSVNGSTYNSCGTNRIGLGTGVFALGAPRSMEFGLRVTF